jgi:hypothetical protein
MHIFSRYNIFVRKIFILLLGTFAFFLFSSKLVLAQNSAYTINNFESQITVNQDASLTVEEKITAEFFVEKHGIYRTIPTTYSANGRTIQAKFDLLSVTGVNGVSEQYSTSKVAQSIQIKIGDPNYTFSGTKTYFIKYKISKILQRYEGYDEVYWNVTGHEWDTDIKESHAVITSKFAKITKIKCFIGIYGGTSSDCPGSQWLDSANFTTTVISPGSDFTIVVGLNSQNQLIFPSQTQTLIENIKDNVGYVFSVLPLLLAFIFWYKKGRDERYESDNVYVKPQESRSQDPKTRSVSIFEREHLPLAYSPIQGITPSQLGTILDEKVDIQDVVAEIVELARLKYLTIEKIKTKGLIFEGSDFLFTKLKKEVTDLKDFQSYLLEKLFTTGDTVHLSKLKNKFYIYLNEFKNKLYKNMEDEIFFAGNPQTTKGLWIAIYFAIGFVFFIIISGFQGQTDNPGPMVLFWILSILGFIFVFSMSKRTAWGHSLFRQAKGLQFYIGEGKWRLEIAEKNLFIEEILPLAICLNVVGKLASQMKDLGVEPPSYMNGFATGMLVSDFNHFNSVTASTLASTPSGKSSWSGGSGFSGGSSGGGFGGGGGGSW